MDTEVEANGEIYPLNWNLKSNKKIIVNICYIPTIHAALNLTVHTYKSLKTYYLSTSVVDLEFIGEGISNLSKVIQLKSAMGFDSKYDFQTLFQHVG